MTFAWTPYALPYLIAGFLMGLLALYVLDHRDTAVGAPFVVMLSATAIWMLLEALMVLGVDLPTKIALSRSTYPVVGLIGPALLLVALRSVEPAARLGWLSRIAIFSIPLLTFPLVVVDDVPGWLYAGASIQEGGPYPRRFISYGPWYYVFTAHAYALVICASALLVRWCVASWRGNAFEVGALMVGIAVPWLAVSLHVARYDPVPHVNALPFGFVIMAGAFAWGFKRTGLLGVMGVGRKLVIEAMRDGVMVTDTRDHLIDINAAARGVLDLGNLRATAQSLAEVLAHHPHLIASLDAREEGLREVELGSSRRSYELQVSAIRNKREHEVSRVLVLRDITERKRAEERIRNLVFYDGLTGLPNRQLFRQRLEGALQGARRYGWTGALLFIGLDGFKLINDTLGHLAGDALIAEVAARFTGCVRDSDVVAHDPLDDTSAVSRIGGDEFTVLLPRISAPQDAAIVAQRLIGSISGAFLIEGSEVFTGASVGMATYPHDGRDPEVLLRNAEAAMYEAKSRGTNSFQFYDDSMNRQNERHLYLEGRLRRALERGELSLHYQPQRDTRTGRVVGCEALLRWHDPEEGSVAPSEFIPLAERAGLIVPIGSWVLHSACAQLRGWQNQGFRAIGVAVNVSGYQIRAGGLVETVTRALDDTGLSPESLEIEITESALPPDDPFTRETLEALRGCGVGLALDDFGTGTSSLTHLRSFPIDRLKIDRSFVSGIPDSREDASLTAAIIAMAHGLQRRVVAEGVETEAQASFLTGEGCDELQGYLIGRPMPAEDFPRFLEAEKP